MVALRKEDIYVTPAEYLAGECLSDTRHEYLAGVVHARSGGSLAHARIAGSIVAELNRQLRGKTCEAFRSDLKVRVRFGDAEFFYYPDAIVDDQSRPIVTLYRRIKGEDWCEEFSGSTEGTLALPEIGCSLPFTAIYERMGF